MPDAPSAPDSTSQTASEFDLQLGGLVRAALLRDGACVVLAKGVRECTVVEPRLLDALQEADFVDVLVNLWSDDEVLVFLERRAQRILDRRSR